MTLYRQLLLCTVLILSSLGSAMWMGELKRSHDYLVSQMATQTQESANFLGLALSTAQGDNEQAVKETMIDALFDSGAYQQITLKDLHGKVVVSRSNQEAILPVPGWFSTLVRLVAPEASAKVMRGWVQTGTVQVKGRLTEISTNLWLAGRDTAIWCALACVVVALLGGLLLRTVLNPLKKIEEQAIALCDRQMVVQQELPRTRELRRVVEAMNTMTERIGRIFAEHAAVASQLKQQVYRDPLTGLGNRYYLESQLKGRSVDPLNQLFGTFFIIQLPNLKALNEQFGYREGDRVLQDLANRLQEGCRRFSDAILARLGGGDVALFLPGVDGASAQVFLEEVLAPASGDGQPYSEASFDLAAPVCGGVFFEQLPPLGDLLKAADMALTQAKSGGGNRRQLLPLTAGSESSLHGRMYWQERVRNLIAEKNIVFYIQSTVQKSDLVEKLGHEVYARVEESPGMHTSLATYIAVAEQFGLTADLERMIFEKLLQPAMLNQLPQRITLNISPSSLLDEAFFAWLCQKLAQCGRDGRILNIEFPETHLCHYGERLKTFANVLKKEGHGVGIDHFGQGLINFGYLQWLMPDYVKIDRAIVDELQGRDQDVRFFIDSLCAVAHSIGVKVVIKNVETEKQLHLLSLVNVDAVQGKAIQPPILLANEKSAQG